MRAIAIIATLDTKGAEAKYLREEIRKLGCDTVVIDMGVVGTPAFRGDHFRYQVARAAGASIRRLAKARDRSNAMRTMASGAAVIIRRLHGEDRLAGVISAGGGQGTSIATRAMRALPLDVPKVMVSTIAVRDTTPYIGTSNIVMVPSVVDLAGLNPLVRQREPIGLRRLARAASLRSSVPGAWT